MGVRRTRVDHLGFGLLLAFLLSGAVGSSTSKAVAAAAAVDIREVPPTLNNAVRLAGYFSEINQGSIQPGLRMDMEKAHLASLQAERRKKPKSKDAAFEDDFESSEVSGLQWESILGGEVSTLCGSVKGRALCFGGDAFAADEVADAMSVAFAMRQAVTGVMNTIAISKVRFSLAVAHPYAYKEEEEEQGGLKLEAAALAKEEEEEEETPTHVVTFEYKAAGGAWTVLQSFSAQNYTTGWQAKAGGGSGEETILTDLAVQSSAIKGEKVFRFVTHEIVLPESTRSLATKFRWQQLKVTKSSLSNQNGHDGGLHSNKEQLFPSWALDDVSILLQGGEGGPPGVLLVVHGTDSFQAHLVSSKLLTVLVHVNTQVTGLEANKFLAEGDARIVSLNKLSTSVGSRIGGVGGAGEHYTLTLLKGRKKATLVLPEKVCTNGQGLGNAASNVLSFPGEEEEEEKKEL